MTDPEKPRTRNSERDGSQPIEWQGEKGDTSVQQEPRSGHRDVESDHERLEDSA
jgi:hypothetical protein